MILASAAGTLMDTSANEVAPLEWWVRKRSAVELLSLCPLCPVPRYVLVRVEHAAD